MHQVRLASYLMDAKVVHNAQFATFVKATGHVTDAERDGVSAVFHLAVDAAPGDILRSATGAPWWLAVRGADWRIPADHAPASATSRTTPWSTSPGTTPPAAGPASDCRPRPSGSTPAGAGWTARATRGRRAGGTVALQHLAEQSPVHNVDDGYSTTAPANAFAPNGHGLHNAVGDVWMVPRTPSARPSTPTGPARRSSPPSRRSRQEKDPAQVRRVMRGGSFYLCHDSYCNRYRVAAPVLEHRGVVVGQQIGFRCANDA